VNAADLEICTPGFWEGRPFWEVPISISAKPFAEMKNSRQVGNEFLQSF